MRAACIAFSGNGSKICKKISEFLKQEGVETKAYAVARYAEKSQILPLCRPLKEWTKEKFRETDLLIFVGAVGIAVRSIAPFVKDKRTDPAVLVIDEKGMFVISLLSGHIGGANEWTLLLAKFLKSTPVVTTATDLNEKLAVDVFAVKNHMAIKEMILAKKIAADFLDGKRVGFLSDFPVNGNIPPELLDMTGENADKKQEAIEEGIHVTIKRGTKPFPRTLHLIPKTVVLGIGCRRGISQEKIESVVEEVLKIQEIERESIEKVCSIELKKDEEGIRQFCRKWKIAFGVFSREELEHVQGEFSQSEFVKKIAGVSNVCERSAVLGSHEGRLIQGKYAKDGVTVAVAVKDWSVKF